MRRRQSVLASDLTLLVNDLCRQAVQTGKLVMRSSGLQQRDFITLTDVGRAVRHLLELPPADCGDGLFNLGGDNSISVWDMVQRVSLRCSDFESQNWPAAAVCPLTEHGINEQ